MDINIKQNFDYLFISSYISISLISIEISYKK